MGKKTTSTKLYFIGIIPPKESYEGACQLKHYFKEHFNSKASLNSPPHITLHMPFQWKEEKEEDLIEKLQQFSAEAKSFQLQLSNFGNFPPRVIFIHVVQNDTLSELHKSLHKFAKRELNLFNANYKDLPFHPHITLAFRDLKKPMFAKAWEEFQSKEFHADFKVSQFALMKHNGKEWEVYRTFSLDLDN
jgi:2'-5' RNA ligase